MSAEPVPEPPAGERCPLCGAAVASRADRCDLCGMTLAGVGSRPGPFTQRTLWLWAAVVFAIYIVAIVIVAAVH